MPNDLARNSRPWDNTSQALRKMVAMLDGRIRRLESQGVDSELNDARALRDKMAVLLSEMDAKGTG